MPLDSDDLVAGIRQAFEACPRPSADDIGEAGCCAGCDRLAAALRHFAPAYLLAALILLSTTSCLPLAAWTAEGYTVDASGSPEAASVAGHCFRLRVDAETVPGSRRIELRGGEAFDVSGRLHVLTPAEASPPGRFHLPKGSTIHVERVLRWRNVETSFLTPYIRVDGAWIDAAELFQGTTPIDRLLEPCEGNSKAN